MRALKVVLIILLSLVGIWLLASLFGPKASHVEASTVIKAPPEAIYDYARYLKNMDEWGVWAKRDRDAKYELTGVDGEVGAKSSWDGDTVQQGSQTITGLDANKSIKTDLAFGDIMVSQVSIDLLPVAEGTEVKWSLHGELPFWMRAMAMVMGMDESVRKDFETGLANLKSIMEDKTAEAAKAPTYEIMTVDRPAMLYVGKREVVKWADMKDFFGKHFGEGMAAVGKAGVSPAGPPSGVYFEWNTADQTADMIAGIPVAIDDKAKLKGLDVYEAPASKALLIDYMGGYESMIAPHEAMDAYLKANNIEHHTNVVEEYVTGPGSEPDSTKWLTKIYYFIK